MRRRMGERINGTHQAAKEERDCFFSERENKMRDGLFLTNLTNKQTWKTCLTDDDGRKTEERIREKKKKLVMDVKIGRRRWRRRARAKQEEEPALPKSLLSIGSDSLEAKVENIRLWNCHFG
jgi:hypothetical protein